MPSGLFKTLFCCQLTIGLTLACIAQNTSLYIEPRVENKEGVNPFNYDNRIFLPTKTYIYDYYIVKARDTLKYAISLKPDGSKSWRYVPRESADSNTVSFLGIKTLGKPGPIMMDKPDYNQTEVFLYHYSATLKPLETELTGVVENEQNVWLHPFRFHALQILQLTPFPYAKLNLKPGLAYQWELSLGKHWPEFTAFKWSGNLKMKCNYKVVGDTTIMLPYGQAPVIKIQAEARVSKWRSQLTSYFNDESGFIMLIYDNVDGSKIVIWLRETK